MTLTNEELTASKVYFSLTHVHWGPIVVLPQVLSAGPMVGGMAEGKELMVIHTLALKTPSWK